MEKQSDACSGQLDSVSYQLCSRVFWYFVFYLCYGVSQIGEYLFCFFIREVR